MGSGQINFVSADIQDCSINNKNINNRILPQARLTICLFFIYMWNFCIFSININILNLWLCDSFTERNTVAVSDQSSRACIASVISHAYGTPPRTSPHWPVETQNLPLLCERRTQWKTWGTKCGWSGSERKLFKKRSVFPLWEQWRVPWRSRITNSNKKRRDWLLHSCWEKWGMSENSVAYRRRKIRVQITW